MNAFVRWLAESEAGDGMMSVSPSPDADAAAGSGGEADERYASLAVLTLAMLLALSLIVGQVLERRNVNWLSEAGGALLIGIVIGLVLNVTSTNIVYEGLFEFSTRFFFIALLPPIIFDAGFNLDVKPFFNNIGAIGMLAFVGTAISTVIVALMMWVLGKIGASFPISLFQASIFGAIISATDPVTVLSVFSRLRANSDLNALVFGESVMNDAVAIVLYRVIEEFGENDVTFGRIAGALWQFTYIFAGSLFIGCFFGLIAAVIFKTRYFRNEHSPLEAALVIIVAYCSFYMTDGLGLSGIVSIMFCGIVMAKYARPNLSRTTDDRVSSFFRIIATLAEIFVFIYIGAALFLQRQAWDNSLTWSFIAFCLLALAVSRLANVYPNIALVNVFRPAEMHVPPSHKFMLWFSGLRGAMAFALAVQARDILDEAADVILTATFFMVLITVLVNGGAAAYLLEKLHLRQGDDPRSPFTPSQFQRLTLQSENSPANTPYAHRTNGSSALEVELGDLNLEAVSPGVGAGRSKSMIIEKIHDFQRKGGITEQFRTVDSMLANFLVADATEPCPVAEPVQDDGPFLNGNSGQMSHHSGHSIEHPDQ